MKKVKRIAALCGVIVLVSLYVVTAVSAFFTTPFTAGLFKASLFSTIAVPCLLYAFMLVYRVLKKHNEEMNKSDDTKKS